MKFAYDSTDKTIKFKGSDGMAQNVINKADHNEKEQQNVRWNRLLLYRHDDNYLKKGYRNKK